MEIELKYILSGRAVADEILSDPMVKDIEDESSFETIDMHSVYYDTKAHDLTRHGIALRVRKEGDFYVATMKDKGQTDEGLHRREEINVRLSDDTMISSPDISIFEQSPVYERLLDIAGKDKLVPVLEMEFERRQVRIDTGESISVLSCDDGEIVAGGKSIPLMELEIELYSGSEDDLRRYGDRLASKYSIMPENKSKFQRGYELIER